MFSNDTKACSSFTHPLIIPKKCKRRIVHQKLRSWVFLCRVCWFGNILFSLFAHAIFSFFAQNRFSFLGKINQKKNCVCQWEFEPGLRVRAHCANQLLYEGSDLFVWENKRSGLSSWIWTHASEVLKSTLSFILSFHHDHDRTQRT